MLTSNGIIQTGYIMKKLFHYNNITISRSLPHICNDSGIMSLMMVTYTNTIGKSEISCIIVIYPNDNVRGEIPQVNSLRLSKCMGNIYIILRVYNIYILMFLAAIAKLLHTKGERILNYGVILSTGNT